MKPRVEPSRTQTKFKTNSILFVVLVYAGVVLLGSIPVAILIPDPQAMMGTFGFDALTMGSFILIIALTLAVMYFTKRESLRVFWADKGKSLRALGIGLLAGFVVNGLISLMAGISGGISYSFNTFSPLLFLIIPFAFIQSSGEEMLGRGFVPAYLEENHSMTIAAVVSSVLFMLSHAGNMALFGFSPVFCINLLLVASIFYVLVKLCGNFWVAAGFHTAWNYTQQYLFGLPNSGTSSNYALFTGANPQSTFFYDAVYGNEGSLISLVVFAVMLLVLVVLLRRKKLGM